MILNDQITIGIFDSGLGGLSVVNEFLNKEAKINLIYLGDIFNSPYGTKTKEEVLHLARLNVTFLKSLGVNSILLGCNTATSATVDVLRKENLMSIFGMEPAVKLASKNNKEKIAVLATKYTLTDQRFLNLVSSLNLKDRVVPYICTGLAGLIDEKNIQEIQIYLTNILTDIQKNNITHIVLGCTHYSLIQHLILEYSPEFKIFDGNNGTVKHIFHALNIPISSKEIQLKIYINSKNSKYLDLSKSYLKFNSAKLDFNLIDL